MMYQRKADMDMLNAVKSMLADVGALALRQSISLFVCLINKLFINKLLFNH